jgi:hypothetical protein
MNCVGLEKLRRKICKPVLPNKKGPGHESISVHWSSRAEAFSFWKLVLRDKLSFHQAKKEILMTERQLAWLREGWPLEARMMEAIHEQRLDTWKDFLYLCEHPEAAPEFQRAFIQSGKAA